MAFVVYFYLLKDIVDTREMALVVRIYAIFILLLLFSVLFWEYQGNISSKAKRWR